MWPAFLTATRKAKKNRQCEWRASAINIQNNKWINKNRRNVCIVTHKKRKTNCAHMAWAVLTVRIQQPNVSCLAFSSRIKNIPRILSTQVVYRICSCSKRTIGRIKQNHCKRLQIQAQTYADRYWPGPCLLLNYVLFIMDLSHMQRKKKRETIPKTDLHELCGSFASFF